MNTLQVRQHLWIGWWLSLVLTLLVAGCGGHSNAPASFTAPPPPKQGATALDPFFVATKNYFFEYTRDTAPFDVSSQFASGVYPVPVSYQTDVTPPSGFILSQESERSFQLWFQADPRVSVMSGTLPASARIRIHLVNGISYGSTNNIIGLTKMVGSSADPRYEVYVTITDPLTQTPMSNIELAKTLTHELGHAFGLGHSPDTHDLMYFQSNGNQGLTPKTFLTYGDAMAVYSTLSNRRVDWIASRPCIVAPPAPFAAPDTAPATNAIARVADTGGTVVCVYTK